MKARIQIVIEDQGQTMVEDIACLERENLSIETLCLTLHEAKTITAGIQKVIITQQVSSCIDQQRYCTCCGKLRHIHGHHEITYHTLFGKFHLKSPRLSECSCQTKKKTTFSPLAKILTERLSPELSYLQSKWVSLMSYGMTAQLLEEVLPIQTNVSSIFYNTQRVSERLEKDLGKEQYMFIDGCQRDWEALPKPDKPLIVGIDGGYVHAREGKNRKAGCFEVIVGKSLQDEHETKRFGFVTKYDTKPKRRLHEMLNNQGLQMNQAITFLTDGGDTVRDLQFYISPQSEHILDWFHVTMRITVLKQMVKNVSIECCAKPEEELESVKWYLWHGNVFKALQLLELFDDDCAPGPESKCTKRNKLSKTVSEFYEYISNNRNFIPNYAERYRYGEAISSAFVESTVNELISKRMVKQQQMRWTQKGAHLLLQVRIKTLNHELRNCFCKWYPRMTPEAERAAA